MEHTHPSIKRIVFASGKASAKLFVRMNKTWLREGKFRLRGEGATDVFSRYTNSKDENSSESLELVVPYSVSPACASVSFKQKLEQWMEIVFDKSSEF